MSIDFDNLPYDPDRLFDKPLIEITQSSVSTFNVCPQRYVFRYLMRLAPYGISVPLVVGTAVHKCFEMIMESRGKVGTGELQKAIDQIFDGVLEGADLAQTPNMEKLEHGRAQAYASVTAWRLINPDWGQTFKIKATEMSVRSRSDATIEGDWTRRMAGKIDGVVVYNGATWLLEHKTRYSIKDQDFVQGLPLDHQVLFYYLLYSSTIADKRKLKRPKGFLYNVIAKPYHRTGATFEQLVERMVRAMIDAPENYFIFEPVEITETAVAGARRNFERLLHQMDSLNPFSVTMKTNACNLYGGCPYRPLCMAGADAGNPRGVLSLPVIDLYRIADVHEELEAPPEDAEIYG